MTTWLCSKIKLVDSITSNILVIIICAIHHVTSMTIDYVVKKKNDFSYCNLEIYFDNMYLLIYEM
jgi:hypothetical protein